MTKTLSRKTVTFTDTPPRMCWNKTLELRFFLGFFYVNCAEFLFKTITHKYRQCLYPFKTSQLGHGIKLEQKREWPASGVSATPVNPVISLVQIHISLKQAHRFYSSLLPSECGQTTLTAHVCVCVYVCFRYREGGSHSGFAPSIVVRLSPVRALWALSETKLQKQPFRPFSCPAPLLYSQGQPGKGSLPNKWTNAAKCERASIKARNVQFNLNIQYPSSKTTMLG